MAISRLRQNQIINKLSNFFSGFAIRVRRVHNKSVALARPVKDCEIRSTIPNVNLL